MKVKLGNTPKPQNVLGIFEKVRGTLSNQSNTYGNQWKSSLAAKLPGLRTSSERKLSVEGQPHLLKGTGNIIKSIKRI